MRTQRILVTLLPLIGALGASAAEGAYGQVASRGGHVETPESSIEQPEHIGARAHTNFKMFIPAAGGMANTQGPLSSLGTTPEIGPPYTGYFFETPASLGCVYQLVSSPVPGCNPNASSSNPSGGARAIAIVDAYHYPTAASDLGVFSSQFGLPQANFQVVYANGRRPAVNANWNIEAALDIEWAHAMAPTAKIYLVEAASASYSDLLTAVSVANSLLKSAGGGEVSMSWGGSEFSTETNYDAYFTQPGVVYFAASGDSPGVIWPSTSPNVVSVGGTSISRNAITGAFQQEIAWQSSGSGPSVYETRPATKTRFRPSCRHDEAPRMFRPTQTPQLGSGSMPTPTGTSSAAPVLLPRFGLVSSTRAGGSSRQVKANSPTSMRIRGTPPSSPTSHKVPAGQIKVI